MDEYGPNGDQVRVYLAKLGTAPMSAAGISFDNEETKGDEDNG